MISSGERATGPGGPRLRREAPGALVIFPPAPSTINYRQALWKNPSTRGGGALFPVCVQIRGAARAQPTGPPGQGEGRISRKAWYLRASALFFRPLFCCSRALRGPPFRRNRSARLDITLIAGIAIIVITPRVCETHT